MSGVAHESSWSFTEGNISTVNPTPAQLYYLVDGIQVPLTQRHRRFIISFKIGGNAPNDVWLKLLPTPLDLGLWKAQKGAGSLLTNGNVGLPAITTQDINIQLAQGNLTAGVGTYRYAWGLKSPDTDSGAGSIDTFGFAAHTLIGPYEDQTLNRQVCFECDVQIASVGLLFSDGTGGQHQISWFLGCLSSQLPQNMYHEDKFEVVL